MTKDIRAKMSNIRGANLGVNCTRTKRRTPKAKAVKEVHKRALINPKLLTCDLIELLFNRMAYSDDD